MSRIQLITVFLHVGHSLMPKSVRELPVVGDIIEAGEHGPLTVSCVAFNEQGDAHVFLEGHTEPGI